MRGKKTLMDLQRVSETLNTGGMASLTETWTTERRLRGVLNQLSANEIAIWGKDTVIVTHKFAFRREPGITILKKDRLLVGTVIYIIQWIQKPANSDKYLTLILQEIQQ